MTIAAGFCCSNGIVLATDSQYTLGYLARIQGPKIFRLKDRNGLRMAVAGAGDVAYMQKAVEDIDRRLDEKFQGPVNHDQISDIIEKVVTRLYLGHLYKCPAPDNERPHFWLLVAVWIEGLGVRLIRTERTAVCYVNGFWCLGVGDILSNYLLRSRYQQSLDFEDIIAIASYVINETKSYVPGCGGETEIVVLGENGTLGNVAQGLINITEKNIATLREQSEHLIQESLNLSNEEEYLQLLVQAFGDAIRDCRLERQKSKESRERVKQKLEEIKRRKEEAGEGQKS